MTMTAETAETAVGAHASDTTTANPTDTVARRTRGRYAVDREVSMWAPRDAPRPHHLIAALSTWNDLRAPEAYRGADGGLLPLTALDPNVHVDRAQFEALRDLMAETAAALPLWEGHRLFDEPLLFRVHPDGTRVLHDGVLRYLVARDLGITAMRVDFHFGVVDPQTGTVSYPTEPGTGA